VSSAGKQLEKWLAFDSFSIIHPPTLIQFVNVYSHLLILSRTIHFRENLLFKNLLCFIYLDNLLDLFLYVYLIDISSYSVAIHFSLQICIKSKKGVNKFTHKNQSKLCK
jgi:hypothetical protein